MVQVIQPRNILGEMGSSLGQGLGQAMQLQAQRNRVSNALDLLSQAPPTTDPVQSYMNVAKALGGVPGAEQFIQPLSEMLRMRAMGQLMTGQGDQGAQGSLSPQESPLSALGGDQELSEVTTEMVPPRGTYGQVPEQAPVAGFGAPTQEVTEGGLGPREALPGRQQPTIAPLNAYRQRYAQLYQIDPNEAEKRAVADMQADMRALEEQRAQSQEARTAEEFKRQISEAQQGKIQQQVSNNLSESATPYKEYLDRYATRKFSEYINDPRNAKKSEEELMKLLGKDIENKVDEITSLSDNLNPGNRLFPTDRKDFQRRIPLLQKQVRRLAKEMGEPKIQEEFYTRGLELGLTKPEALDLAYPPNEGVSKVIGEAKSTVGNRLKNLNANLYVLPDAEKRLDKTLRGLDLVNKLAKEWDGSINPAQVKGDLVKTLGMTDGQADNVLSQLAKQVPMTGEQKRWLSQSMERYEPVVSELYSRFWDFFPKRT